MNIDFKSSVNVDGHISSTANISGSAFYGDGSQLTGVVSLSNVADETTGAYQTGVRLGDVANNVASGQYAVAEGQATTASGKYSHAEGYRTTASGYGSHAEGQGTTASGDYSHAEAFFTAASGYVSHAEGYQTTARGFASHAEGQGTTASGDYSHAQGRHTIASGGYSHAEGDQTTASGDYSHAEGHQTTASGYSSHAEGYQTIASGYGSHTEGVGTDANNTAHAEGVFTKSEGYGSHSEGYKTSASSDAAHAEGYKTTANGDYGAHAEGRGCIAEGYSSHAEGRDTAASGESSHAQGRDTIASGAYSHAAGRNAQALHSNTFVWSDGTSFNSNNAQTFNVHAANGVHISGGGLFVNNNSVLTTDAADENIKAGIDDGINTVGETAFDAINNGWGLSIFNSSANSTTGGVVTANFSDPIYIVNVNATAGTLPAGVYYAITTEPMTVGANNNAISINSGATDILAVYEGQYGNEHVYSYTVASETAFSNINFFLGRPTSPFTARFSLVNPITATISFGLNDNISVVGNISGAAFYGDGSNLTGVGGGLSNAADDGTGVRLGDVANNVASGQYAVAAGQGTTASGNYSHTEGYKTTANGDYGAHAEGRECVAEGYSSHAEGRDTTAGSNHIYNTANHAEGGGTTCGIGSFNQHNHAEGQNTWAGIGSYNSNNHAEGNGARAGTSNGTSNNHAEGTNTRAGISSYSSNNHAEGGGTTAGGTGYSSNNHAEGSGTIAGTEGLGNNHAEGQNTSAISLAAHAEGKGTVASGYYSHAEGEDTIASGQASHSSGANAQAVHDNAFVWSDGAVFASTAANTFNIRAANGTHIHGGQLCQHTARAKGGATVSHLVGSPTVIPIVDGKVLHLNIDMQVGLMVDTADDTYATVGSNSSNDIGGTGTVTGTFASFNGLGGSNFYYIRKNGSNYEIYNDGGATNKLYMYIWLT